MDDVYQSQAPEQVPFGGEIYLFHESLILQSNVQGILLVGGGKGWQGGCLVGLWENDDGENK